MAMWRARASTRTSPRPAPRRRWAGRWASTSGKTASASPSRTGKARRSTRLTITGDLERTVTDKEDQKLTFQPMGAGVYSAPAALSPRRLGGGDRCRRQRRFRLSQDLPLRGEGRNAVTLPCCTIDGEYFQPFKLEGEDAERWISTAGPGLKRIEFLVPQANRPEAMAQIETDLPATRGRRIRPRQPHRPPRRRHLPRGRDRAAGADRPAGSPRLHGPPLRPARDRPHQGRPRRRPPAPRAGGRGLRRLERHAAVGLRLVGCRGCDARSLPLALRHDRASRGRLCRPALLLFRGERAAARPRQHGRADLAGRAAGLADEPVPDHQQRGARLFRRLRHAPLLPAGGPLSRPPDARARALGHRTARLALLRRRHPHRGRRHPPLRSRARSQGRHDGRRRRGRQAPGGRPRARRHQRHGPFAADGRVRA